MENLEQIDCNEELNQTHLLTMIHFKIENMEKDIQEIKTDQKKNTEKIFGNSHPGILTQLEVMQGEIKSHGGFITAFKATCISLLIAGVIGFCSLAGKEIKDFYKNRVTSTPSAVVKQP